MQKHAIFTRWDACHHFDPPFMPPPPLLSTHTHKHTHTHTLADPPYLLRLFAIGIQSYQPVVLAIFRLSTVVGPDAAYNGVTMVLHWCCNGVTMATSCVRVALKGVRGEELVFVYAHVQVPRTTSKRPCAHRQWLCAVAIPQPWFPYWRPWAYLKEGDASLKRL
jgi:hypothetical protein